MGWFGWEGSSKPIQCHMAGTPPTVPGGSGPIQPGLGHCQGSRGSPSFPGSLVQCPIILKAEVFPHIQLEFPVFQFVPIVPSPVTEQSGPIPLHTHP